jgi:uncharacterized protein YjbI with pentapeptide repeats
MPRNIILIDKRVQDYETIITAVDNNKCIPVLFDYYEDTIEDIKGRLNDCVINEPPSEEERCIGLLQHNYNEPFYYFTAKETQGSIILDVTKHDPDLTTWGSLHDFITWCRITPEIRAGYFDMMACALYSDRNPDWKYIIDSLAIKSGVVIRASTDDTGSAILGGNWFLETHTGVNLKTIYFTDAIETYTGILFKIRASHKYLRSYEFKGFATGSIITWGYSENGGNSSAVSSSLSSGVVSVYSTDTACAALKSNGSVVTWGNSSEGGDSSAVAASLSSGVVSICPNNYAFAALKSNGSVITWGSSSYGGNSSTVASSLSSGVIAVYSSESAFAALKGDGSVVAWGIASAGGDTSTVTASLSSGVVSVYSNISSFAAIKSNGSVVTWGSSIYGGNSSAVASSLSSGVIAVYSVFYAFAALKSNGSVVTWGSSTYGGDSSSVSASLTSDVITVYSNLFAFAALKNNGSVITWGLLESGGNSSNVSSNLTSGVVNICSTGNAFAALKSNGSVITWGDSRVGGVPSIYFSNNNTYISVASSLTSDIVSVYSSGAAFAALKIDGSVVTWGSATSGGNSSSVSSSLTSGVVSMFTNAIAFTALKNNGSVITWGDLDHGGNSSVYNMFTQTYTSVASSLTSNIIAIHGGRRILAALKTTETTFDLSMSYYTEMDRYFILSAKENRRRVNLTTLNDNVFTISQAQNIKLINPNIPADKILRIIIPSYVSSSYSITSTATIPYGAGSVIIACGEGEPVSISGATYVNYGTFIYRIEPNNTYTQVSSDNIGGTTYNLYGGDGINASGIVLVVLYPPHTLSNFPNLVKVSTAPPFQLTPPTSISPGTFSYTSSNTNIATIAGDIVTVRGFGTTTITATQASDNVNYGVATITATLTTIAANYYGADLSGSDFTNVSLYAAVLNLTNLTNAVFIASDLSGATLLGATLTNILSRSVVGLATATLPTGYVGRSGSIFGNNVRITGANLTNADLSGIILTNSDVSGATFTGATLTNIRTGGLTGTSTATLPAGYVFRNGILVGPNVSLTGAALTSADLSGVSIAGADLSGTVLTNANLTNLVSGNLRNASTSPGGTTVLPTGYLFYNNFIVGPAVNLSGTTLTNIDLSGAGIGSANLTATKLSGANVSNASLFNMDISGVDLSGATITGIRSFGLTGGTSASTRLPTGYFSRASTANTGTIVGPAVNLSYLTLQNIDLSGGIALTGANLTGTDLSGASTNLTGVITGNLVGANTATLPVGYIARNGFIVGPRVVLRGADLSGQNLTGVDLSGVDLSGANLSNSILTNANIHPTTTNLTNTILTGVISGGLTGAGIATPSTTLPTSYRIRGGFLVGPAVNLSNAVVSSVDLSNVNLNGATLTNANLTGSILTNITSGALIGAATATLPDGYIARGTGAPGTFIVGPNVILRGANLTNANLTGISIAGCDVSGVTFTGATVIGLISGGLVNAANITALPSASYVIRANYIVGPDVNLSGSTLTSQNFTGLSVAGANFTSANLAGATFTTTTVTNANFTGANFTNVTCGGGLVGVTSATLPSAAYVARAATYNVFLGPYIITRNLNFTNIDLTAVSLVGADLSGCNLTAATLTNADISGANLRGTTLTSIITGGLISNSSGATVTTLPTGYIIRGGFIVGPSVNLVGANLSNQDISGQSLVGVNLTGANFLGANFTRVVSGSITGADSASLPNGYVARNGYILGPYVLLRGITTGLTGINISGVPLTGADLSGCVFTNSDFTNVDISGANLSRVTFTGVTSGGITGGTSTALVMPTGFVMRGGYILGAGVSLINANLTGSLDLTDVILTNANISGANFTGANFTRLITGGVINNATAPSLATLPAGYVFRSGFIIGPNVSLANAVLTNVDLSGVSLSGTNMTSTNISGASTILTNVVSGGIVGLDTTTLPTGYFSRNGYIIGAGVIARGAALSSFSLASINMTGIDLSGATLTSSILTNATLTGAILTNVNLTNAITGGGITGLVGVNAAVLPTGYVARTVNTNTNGFIIGPRVSLQNATLTGGIDLSGVDLTSVNFTGANLTGSILTNANISGANFTNTTLTSVVSGGLTGAATATLRTGYVVRYTGGGGAGTGSGYLIGAGVSLAGADLSGVDMSGIVLTSTIFTNANLTNAILRNATLTTANLSGATVTGLLTGSIIGLTTATLPSASYVARGGGGSVGWIVGPGVRLVGANLSSTDLTDLIITGCDVSGANFSSATITRLRSGGLRYGGASAASANITLPNGSTTVRGASGNGYLVGPHVSLVGANFNGIDLSGAIFTGADISGAIFTTTTNLANITTGELRNASLATFPTSPPQSTGYFAQNGFIVGPGVRLNSADLSGTILTGYSIARANLTGANLTNAIFTGADISGANFTSANFTGVISTGGGITGGNPTTDGTIFPTIVSTGVWGVRAGFLLGPTAVARSASLGAGGPIDVSGINLRSMDLSGANLTGVSFTNNEITGANFTNAVFTGVSSQGLIAASSGPPTFAGTSANYSLRGGCIIGPSVNLANKNLTGVNLANTTFTNANCTNANLTNAILTAADISGTTFTGATFTGIRSGQINSPASSIALPANFQLRGGFILGPACNLSEDDLTNVDASGTNLANAVITSGTNFTNTLIVGATITGITFTTVQKSQMRRNAANVAAGINALTITTVIPSDLPLMNAVIRFSEITRLTGGIDVYTPVIGGGDGGVTVVSNFTSDTNLTKGVYVNIPNHTVFQITGNYAGDTKQYSSTSSGIIVDASQNPVSIIRIRNTAYRVYAGSLIGIPINLNEYRLGGIAGLYDVLMEDSGYGSAPRGSTGPSGTPGATATDGATGPTGATPSANGATGPDGLIGSTGPGGATGPSGPIGPTGPIGYTGSTGVYGRRGPDGVATEVGDTGPIGEDGSASGQTGPRGIPGIVDYVGATGPSPGIEHAPTGPNGVFSTIGATGATGMIGPTGEYTVWAAATATIGTTGIYYNGRVSIGKPSPDNGFALDVSGGIRCIGINNVSDYRIKENICDSRNIERGFPSFKDLRGAHYWNTLTNRHEYGFIAHEVAEIYPELIDGERDAENKLQSVDYRSMFAILARDIQELKERISNAWSS